jgi:hypothetical protein
MLPAAAFAMLTACATPGPQFASQLEQKAVCCESIDQMEFTPLPAGKDTSVKVDANNRVYAFDSGKSYFLAYQLPPDTRDHDLRITTYVSGFSRFDFTVFYPHLLLLDAHRQVRRKLPAPGVRYDLDFLRGANWTTPLALERDDAYLVIYTSPAVLQYGLPTAESSGHAGVIGNVPYYSPGSPADLVPTGPTGTLVLSWIRREPARSTAEPPAKAADLPSLDKPGATVLSGSVLERSLMDWDGFQVAAVDEQRVDYGWTGNPFKMPIALKPGTHTVLVQFRTTKGYAMGDWPDAILHLTGDLQANHRYRVVGSIDNGVATAWIEDVESRERVSEQSTGSMYWQTPLRMRRPAGG